ncbi:OsmC family protein [Enterovirga aerilata]|uniref:OsmC family peroxiredoxin n=1 Tax=Enterovirga aerilata TaxID=2730920 RepID=A0A849I6I9_9HYPH|nr:OsmC family protein [Enterovirga sp. DB1703]NNM72998.1 OsmC family peroxiredoxin [Enterovirga sp. DB1703]
MAHEYRAVVDWRRDGAVFTDGKYGRSHRWIFDGGVEVPASSAPSSVPLPLSRADAVDPEEALCAAVSSCHMLFFLAFAAKEGFVVDSYRDEAVATMSRNARAKLYVSKVGLNPLVAFSGERQPSQAEIAKLHHQAHAECYIANSILAEVTVAGLAHAEAEPA